MTLTEHLVMLPIVLPLAAGSITLVIDERRLALKAAISVGAALLQVAAAVALVRLADESFATVYPIGNWPAPFGIVLVVDRLAAILVLLTCVLGVAALVFSLARWQRAGPRFHSLVQFLLMGVNGAFLTGDLFNLFVFFEVLLAASYGLALHGSGGVRVGASLHYVVVNLTASLLLLVGISLIYGATGTLNMADLALRWRDAAPPDRALFEAGAAILGVAFLVKAGMWPLCFWLQRTYSAASAPAAALFAVLTKVGVYAVLRTGLLFGTGSEATPSVGTPWLAYGGMATIAFGALGVLASQDMGRLASYSVLVSSGTLLAAIAIGSTPLTGAALYYLVVSTLALSALFLLVELVERGRRPGAEILAVTAEAFGAGEDEGEELEIGIAIPAATALLGLSFAGCAIMLAGLPPLAGFIGKFAILNALLVADPVPAASWALLALLVGSGMATIIAMARAGVRRFWATSDGYVPRVRAIELVPIALLLALCVALTVGAGTLIRYLDQGARALHAPGGYVDRVLGR
ncbi:MAG TPA: monovalent cation/H+ antiporter subunit D [Casimicrobiaceae bacterium]|nr:monovalent cation/H+ antiporter subunit D [Casimicrobiaceae bacterium]